MVRVTTSTVESSVEGMGGKQEDGRRNWVVILLVIALAVFLAAIVARLIMGARADDDLISERPSAVELLAEV